MCYFLLFYLFFLHSHIRNLLLYEVIKTVFIGNRDIAHHEDARFSNIIQILLHFCYYVLSVTIFYYNQPIVILIL